MDCLIASLRLPADTTILEAGCGTGGNLSMLARHGRVHGFEPEPVALQYATERNAGVVAQGTLPNAIPFGTQSFGLIALFDVLEHVEHDAAALAALHARLHHGGALLLTVPAFAFLWSEHDRTLHHFKRYQTSEIRALLEGAGFEVSYLSYYNFFLFPIVYAVRRFCPVTREHKLSDVPPRLANIFLEMLFGAERFLMPRLRFPFGVSIVAIARKR